MSKVFDSIDAISSTVAHRIRYEHPDEILTLMHLKMRAAYGFLQSEDTNGFPTLLTDVARAIVTKKEFLLICGQLVGESAAFHQGATVCDQLCKDSGTTFSKHNFHEVVCSKLYELLLWSHTSKVLEKINNIANTQKGEKKCSALAYMVPMEDDGGPSIMQVH